MIHKSALFFLLALSCYAQRVVGSGQITHVSGDGNVLVTTKGAQTSGDCVKIDTQGNHVAAGSACGGGGGSATPGGSDKQVQFNSSGTFAGDSGLTYDATNAFWSQHNLWIGAAQVDGFGQNFPSDDPKWSPLTIFGRSDNATTFQEALAVNVNYTITNNGQQGGTGGYFQVLTDSAQTANGQTLTGVSGYVEHQGTGSQFGLTGGDFESYNDQANVSYLYGAYIQTNSTAGNVTNNVTGIRIQAGAASGSLQSLHGVDAAISGSGLTFTNNAADPPSVIRVRDASGVVASALNINSQGANSKNVFEGTVTTGKLVVTLHTPASSSETCTAGQIADDADYHYVCTATNTWKRVVLETF